MSGASRQVALAAGLAVAGLGAPVEATTSFDVVFEDCTEFVGISSVPIENVEARVPARFVIAGDGTTALIVVRIVDCGALSVGARSPRPGRVVQIGVTVVGEGTADIDNFTLWYGTDDPRLRARLRAAGMDAVRVGRFSYDLSLDAEGEDILRARVAGRKIPNHTVVSRVQGTDGDPAPFVARWMSDGRYGATVQMVTSFPDLAFGLAQSILRTPPRSALAGVLGGAVVEFRVLDSYNAWTTATMVVSVD